MTNAGGCAAPSQFGRPRGLKGWLIGHLMAIKNRAMNDAALLALDPDPADRVLEIGCGPGVTLAELAERLTRGFVAGIDHSEEMVRQATRRAGAWIGRGRAEVRLASVAAIPYPDASFDGVFAVNSFQFWPDPVAALVEIKRVLRPGGRLVLTLRSADRKLRFDLAGAAHGPARVSAAAAALAQAGFGPAATTTRPAGRELAVSLAAALPGD